MELEFLWKLKNGEQVTVRADGFADNYCLGFDIPCSSSPETIFVELHREMSSIEMQAATLLGDAEREQRRIS